MDNGKFKIALAQTKTCSCIEDNLEAARRMIADAAAQGAELIVFPEVFLAAFPANAVP